LPVPAQATYPGHNGLIAFSGGDPNGGAQIWTVNPRGRDLRQLTHLNGDALNQDWSPDGRRIVFELDAPDGSAFSSFRSGAGLENENGCFAPRSAAAR
jgi:Tol biopolymer transport system component